jgi:hypothetical protein
MPLNVKQSTNPETAAGNIEAALRSELGTSQILSYEIEQVHTPPKSFLAHLYGKGDELFRVRLELPNRPKTSLWVSCMKNGMSTIVTGLLYSTELSKPINGAVTIPDPGSMRPHLFSGDTELSAKLNGNKELVKRANAFVETELQASQTTIQIEGHFSIQPQGKNSLLLARTLGKQGGADFALKWLLAIVTLGVSNVFAPAGIGFGAIEFLEIASAFEQAI